jgi:nicotinamide riboside kinase
MVILLLVVFSPCLVYSAYIEGIDTTDINGYSRDSVFRVSYSKVYMNAGLKMIFFLSELGAGYYNYKFDDIKKAPAKHGEITSIMEQYRLLEKQCEWEDSVLSDKLDIMITDSPVFLGWIYCVGLSKGTSKEIMFFNDIFKKMVKLNYPKPRYNIIFHLNPDLKPVNDGIRLKQHFNKEWREEADIMIKATMMIFKPSHFYVLEQKDFDKRVSTCLEIIKKKLEGKI